MAKVTSKLQVTVPKVIADQYGIRPGDDIEWTAAGEAIRVVPTTRQRAARGAGSVKTRLRLFDLATARQRQRQVATAATAQVKNRGWRREDLYDRGRSR